jgi:hypothetical protein
MLSNLKNRKRMKNWTMALCAGLMLFSIAAEAKPNNPNKQHQKAWIQQHKMQKQQEKLQKEQYKAVRKQQKDIDKTNRRNDDGDYGYQNYPEQPQNQGKQQPQGNDTWGLGDILGSIGI